jgi:hypothetical protein
MKRPVCRNGAHVTFGHVSIGPLTAALPTFRYAVRRGEMGHKQKSPFPPNPAGLSVSIDNPIVHNPRWQ